MNELVTLIKTALEEMKKEQSIALQTMQEKQDKVLLQLQNNQKEEFMEISKNMENGLQENAKNTEQFFTELSKSIPEIMKQSLPQDNQRLTYLEGGMKSLETLLEGIVEKAMSYDDIIMSIHHQCNAMDKEIEQIKENPKILEENIYKDMSQMKEEIQDLKQNLEGFSPAVKALTDDYLKVIDVCVSLKNSLKEIN